MKFSMRLLKVVALNVAVVAASFALYQNCSKVQVSDLSSQTSNVQGNPALPSEYSKITVGISELADLKMLFVVDNSYTMKQNNINLATSFQTLFNAQNSDNLTLFPVTSYLLTVGQKTPAATLTDQTRLEALRTWEIPVAGLTSSQLSAGRTPDQLGKVAGDSIGYSILKNGSSYSFEPATVLGLNGSGAVVNSIYKGKSESANAMVQDFQDRMTLLQNMSVANYETNKDILDNESGLCAVARMLRSSSYVKAGDLAVLNVFTDENDADAAGKSCLAGYTYSEGTDDLVDGGCETHRTTFNYKVNTNLPAQCIMNYNDTFNWSLNYTSKQWSSSLQYYKIDSYNCAQTALTFQAVTAWKKKKTSIVVTYNTYKVLDGVQVVDPTARTRSISVDGYKSASECTTYAKSNLNSGSELYVSNTCVNSTDSVASCSFSDANCVIDTQAARSFTVTGDSTDPTSCLNAAKSQDANAIAGTQQCSLTGATVNTPWLYVGCTPVISASRSTVTGLATDLSLQSNCDAKARSMDHGYVDATHTAICSSSQIDVPHNATGVLNLVDYASVTAGGNCPADVQTKAVSTVSGLSASAVTGCTVSIPVKSSNVNLTAADCNAQAASFCSSNPSLKNCVLKSTTSASVVQTAAALTADENLSCTSTCGSSQTGFCKTTASLATVDPSMTIADYLVQAQKSVVACAASTVAISPDISKFNGKLKADLASLCPAKTTTTPSVPVYARVDKTYRFKGFAPDYIAGNVLDNNGVPQPKTDLPTYITQRALEIFGGQKPIVNVFVRTANDPLGDAGSRGIAYEQLGVTMNAQVYSVLSTDYSAALKDLSSVIKAQMLRTFKVPGMDSGKKVIGVIWRPKSAPEKKLDPSLWVQSGASVQIADSVQLTIGDEIQFEYQ